MLTWSRFEIIGHVREYRTGQRCQNKGAGTAEFVDIRVALAQTLTKNINGLELIMVSQAELISDVEDPMALFEDWINAAKKTEPNDFDAMSLATATPEGFPSVRMVLLKGLGPEGFVFYTNKESRKGEQISKNPRAALCFHWKTLRRQIRIEGNLSEVGADLADQYFATRSRESCLAAWAAAQSRPMSNRQDFENLYRENEEKFRGRAIGRPSYWSGFCLSPCMIEFWLDLPHRMHDRLCYTRDEKGWTSQRLYP